ncbi:hypothetical protein PROP_00586 [Propionicimonas sp. T2.31MG-18]
MFTHFVSHMTWSLSAAAIVFLPDVFSTDITRPADYMNTPPN